jgi:hypothetical protein
MGRIRHTIIMGNPRGFVLKKFALIIATWAVEAPRSHDQFGPVPSKLTRGSFSVTAARTRDDDDFAFDVIADAIDSCLL